MGALALSTREPEDDVAESAQAEPVAEDAESSADPEAEIKRLCESLQASEDAVLRARADLENATRRHRRQLENAHRFGAEAIVGQLLPVVDSLESALELEGQDAPAATIDQLQEGNRLILNLLSKALEGASVEPINPKGEPFDPDLHQAISMLPTDQTPPNHVAEVMQKGYRLHDRLVRPAMVVVAQQVDKNDQQQPDKNDQHNKDNDTK